MLYIYPESVPDGNPPQSITTIATLRPRMDSIWRENLRFIVTLGGVGAGSRKSPRPLDQPSAISHRGSVERMCSQLPTSGLAILRLRSRSFLPHRRNNDAQPVVWMAWVKLVHAPLSSNVAEVSLRRLGLRTVRPDLNTTRMSAYIYSFQRHLSFSFLLFGLFCFLRGVEVGYAMLDVWPV